MIDLLTIQVGDIVEYGPYICSKGLEDERFTGTYRGFDFWAPDDRPAEVWIDLIAHRDDVKGMKIRVRASQITNVWRDPAEKEKKQP